ncbi:MAG: hypothetical protein K1W21_07260, partial [Oscillospiraceae bacterium]
MPYIHFTEEQKLQANTVDLVEFLRFKGEPLIREGSEYRLGSNHSVNLRGNDWFAKADENCGLP